MLADCIETLVNLRCQIRYRYNFYGKRHPRDGRLLSFNVLLRRSKAYHGPNIPRLRQESFLCSEEAQKWSSAGIPINNNIPPNVHSFPSPKGSPFPWSPSAALKRDDEAYVPFALPLKLILSWARWWKGVSIQHTQASWARR